MEYYSPSPGAQSYQSSYDAQNASAHVAEATITQLNAAMRNAEALTAFIDEEEYLVNLLRELEERVQSTSRSAMNRSGGGSVNSGKLTSERDLANRGEDRINQHDALMYIYTRTEELIQEALQVNTTVGSLDHMRAGGTGMLFPSEVAAMSEHQQQLSVAAQKLWLERQDEAKRERIRAQDRSIGDGDTKGKESSNFDQSLQQQQQQQQQEQEQQEKDGAEENKLEEWRQVVADRRANVFKWVLELEGLQKQYSTYRARIKEKERELALLARGSTEISQTAQESPKPAAAASSSGGLTLKQRSAGKKQQPPQQQQLRKSAAAAASLPSTDERTSGSATINELEAEVARYRTMCDTLTKIVGIPL